MNSKKFISYFFYTIVGFVLFNFIIWNLYTEKILIRQDDKVSGDLTRMGYIPELIYARETKTKLLKKHMEASGYDLGEIDIITIGDSFSNGNAGGLNAYYQDYLATKYGLKILNLVTFPTARNDIETTIILANSGFLKKANVRYVLIESTQRKVVQRFSIPVNYDLNVSYETVKKNYKFASVKENDIHPLVLPKTSFINNGNFKFVFYRLLYNFSERAFISDVHHVQLNKKMFSVGDGKQLLYYDKDIGSIKHNTRDNLVSVNENLNRLSEFLEKQGIKLIFMPAVSKYDLYSPYIINNQNPNDPFFEEYRKLPKKYIFIDTKAILLSELEKEEKDIFYCDDTHWSFKASNLITTELSKELRK